MAQHMGTSVCPEPVRVPNRQNITFSAMKPIAKYRR